MTDSNVVRTIAIGASSALIAATLISFATWLVSVERRLQDQRTGQVERLEHTVDRLLQRLERLEYQLVDVFVESRLHAELHAARAEPSDVTGPQPSPEVRRAAAEADVHRFLKEQRAIVVPTEDPQ